MPVSHASWIEGARLTLSGLKAWPLRGRCSRSPLSAMEFTRRGGRSPFLSGTLRDAVPSARLHLADIAAVNRPARIDVAAEIRSRNREP